ncbi:uncharacterized protein LOC111366462 isoform X2 [Olea europaea var. sylvestris]|uniref:uncharacterized protein LOC111366462 isoform X2 n=1 Tax=Olea europaea var. sylvestris TaxID=158386 RepID=UPI000C1D1086|nr:uncharacterized protein LOC111366462 isoform X2 [Olea europaea var. sylvestris]
MEKMVRTPYWWLSCLAILLLITKVKSSEQPQLSNENWEKTAVFLSPKFVLEPGSVSNKDYYNIDFPRGHIAIKSFNGEVIDETGNPVPLHETYLHHWVVLRYHQRKGVDIPKHHGNRVFDKSDYFFVRNSGVCDHGLSYYFGIGSETRKMATHVPDPYGIEIGNHAEIPDGYEEKWMLNVHAIDTRGVLDRLGCTECRCDLYNVTVDEHGHVLPSDYYGGLRCCYDETKCMVKEGFHGVKRSLYVRYTVKYIDWDASIVPVKIYVLDVTDVWTRPDESRGVRSRHYCRDGRVICSSNPVYGEGNEAGNEAGYVVGMSTCYPSPGTVKISDGELLTLVSNYSSAHGHTGVMGLFYLLVADSSTNTALHSLTYVRFLFLMS